MAIKKTSIAVAANSAAAIARRFEAVEREAERIHTEQTGAAIVRALLGGAGLHAVITDGKATLEICNGKVAVSVTRQDETEPEEER